MYHTYNVMKPWGSIQNKFLLYPAAGGPDNGAFFYLTPVYTNVNVCSVPSKTWVELKCAETVAQSPLKKQNTPGYVQ